MVKVLVFYLNMITYLLWTITHAHTTLQSKHNCKYTAKKRKVVVGGM